MDGLVFGWRSALLLVLIGQLIVVAGLFLARRFDRRANAVLAALLCVVALTLTPQVIGFAGFYDAFPWLSFAPLQNELLVGPLLMAYAFALTRGAVPAWVWLLMLPGAIDLAYHTYWFLQPFATRWARIGAFHEGIYVPVRTGLALALLIAGLSATARLYADHRAFMADQSSAAAEFDPRWLPFFLAMSGLVLGAWVMLALTDRFIPDLGYRGAYPFFVLTALCFWGLGQGALILHREAFPKIGAASLLKVRGPAEPSPGPARDWAGLADQLRRRIKDEGWHLEPRLSAPELARRLGTNETYLSRTVNLGAGMNFNRFINEIRVDAVKARLSDGAGDLLATALSCGFNSKASFNRVFKEITGQTPAAFRKRLTGR